MPEPDALARALDQARDVGDDELASVRRLDGAEHRRERRERILRDLRPRVRDPREQRRLARVRQADERGVGEQLEAELDDALVTRHAHFGIARRLARRRREALVAAAARAALRDDDARSRVRQVGDQPVVRIDDLRPDGNDEHRVLAALARREAAASRTAAAGLHLLVRAEAGEIAPLRIRDEDDVAAVAAVTAVRAALRHELLTAKVDGTVAAAAGDHGQAGAIVEHAPL